MVANCTIGRAPASARRRRQPVRPPYCNESPSRNARRAAAMLLSLLLLLLPIATAAAGAAGAAGAAAADLQPGPPPPQPTLSLEAVEANTKKNQVKIEVEDSRYLLVDCQTEETALDRPLRARRATRVRKATFVHCAPPAAGYRAVLARLDVELAPRGQLVLRLAAGGPPLGAAHLAGLNLSDLTLQSTRSPPSAAADLLRRQEGLLRLEVRGVPLQPDALEHASPSLKSLKSLTMVGAGPVRVPAALLAQLTALVADAAVRAEGEAPALLVLRRTLAPNATLPRADRLTALSLTAWSGGAWQACASLRSLSLIKARMEALPARWLAACGALRSLEVVSARGLRSPPAGLLAGAGSLTSVRLWRCGLEELPRELFDSVPNLRELDLSYNNLTVLPGGIFTSLRSLTKLVLSANDFDEDVFAVLNGLDELRELDLSRNRRLGDACSGGPGIRSGPSSLAALRSLSVLLLNRTNLSRICSDWRSLRRLRLLSLQYTHIASLSADDLRYDRDGDVESPVVDLLGSMVRGVLYSAEDEAAALAAPDASVRLLLPDPLRCDCDLFHAARALRRRPGHARLAGFQGRPLRCDAGRELRDVEPDDMLCAAPCGALPAGCRCGGRPLGAAPGWYLRLSCERAGLRAVPVPARPPDLAAARVRWDLRLAHNDIAALDELPADVRRLDLRYNRVENASASVEAALASLEELDFGAHPLRCDCGAGPLLRGVAALGARAPAALRPARCADGRSLRAASAAHVRDCFPPWRAPLVWSLGCALLALAGAALAAAAALARPTGRARLKLALRRWGWLPRDSEPEDARRPYDAFLSYAHEDEAAARRVTERLEAHGLRLCLHSRDWAPGEYIEAQIAASVRGSRRTVALVSRHWTASSWARVELRMALHGSVCAPRLVLVLLEPETALRPDRELRRCLATCTYLHVEHPLFWENLLKALPRPSLPAPAPAAVPPPAGAPEPASSPVCVPLDCASTRARGSPKCSDLPRTPIMSRFFPIKCN